MTLDRLLFPETPEGGAALGVGSYSLGGGDWGAVADREYRHRPLVGPGGFRWCPREGEEVLLLRTGDGDLCAGVSFESQGLAPGEAELSAGGGTIRLGQDGSIRLTSKGGGSILLGADGTVAVNGQIFPKEG